MKVVIAKWEDGTYSLHFSPTAHRTNCFWGIDALGNPMITSYKVFGIDDLRGVYMESQEHMKGFFEEGSDVPEQRFGGLGELHEIYEESFGLPEEVTA